MSLTSWMPTPVRKRSLAASSGGLNLAYKTCRWSKAAPCFASGCEQTHLWFLSLDLWEIRLYSQKLKKAGKKRESLTSWASKVPHLLSAAIWSLAGVWPFSLQLLPPFFSQAGFWLALHAPLQNLSEITMWTRTQDETFRRISPLM